MLRAVRASGVRSSLLIAAIVGGLGLTCSSPVGASTPPDGRAYELVSPPQKNGGDVMANSARTRVAADGGAVTFSSLTGFADVAGTGAAVDYMAVRSSVPDPGANGWTTHAITPLQHPLSFLAGAQAMDPLYEGDLSADLSRGVFRAWSLLSDSPNVGNVENLYLRTDLRSPGPGSYRLLSDAIAPVGSALTPLLNLGKPALTGASSDFKHVLFSSPYSLTADATGGGPWLYEWDDGTLRVAGVLPDGTALSGAIAGQSTSVTYPRSLYTPHVISADGSKIVFTDPSTGFNGNDGTIYMREGGTTTVQLTASERTNCADTNPCDGTPEPDPSSPQPAVYWDASVDGGRVFVTTTEALTDDAPLNGDRKLYMYDSTKPSSDPHNLTLLSVDNEPADPADVQGVIGASADGSYVYFIAVGQLVAGEPVLNGSDGVFLWHDGVVSYVGELAHRDDSTFDLNNDLSLFPTDARVTPDGRHLLFMSSGGIGLTGYDHGTCVNNGLSEGQCRELYVYDADSGQLRCASCNPSGAAATADAAVVVRTATGSSVTTWAKNRVITDDGRRVFFTTREALVPQDTNGRLDGYEYDTSDGSVHVLSTGKDPSDSYFLNASPNGNDAFILTRQRLVGWDTDSAYDLYDVRVGGGFPDPALVPPACSGDSCHGTPAAPPAASLPRSAPVIHPARHAPAMKPKPKRKPAVHCKRGFVRKRVRGKVRCVRRPKHVAKHAHAGRKGQ